MKINQFYFFLLVPFFSLCVYFSFSPQSKAKELNLHNEELKKEIGEILNFSDPRIFSLMSLKQNKNLESVHKEKMKFEKIEMKKEDVQKSYKLGILNLISEYYAVQAEISAKKNLWSGGLYYQRDFTIRNRLSTNMKEKIGIHLMADHPDLFLSSLFRGEISGVFELGIEFFKKGSSIYGGIGLQKEIIKNVLFYSSFQLRTFYQKENSLFPLILLKINFNLTDSGSYRANKN